jgi:PAS domain S-box-containing protein
VNRVSFVLPIRALDAQLNREPAPIAPIPNTSIPDTSILDELPLPYIEIDSHGVITRANRATLELHPLDRGQLIGRIAWDLMAADEKDQSFAAYCSTLESGREPGVVLRSLCDRSGQFRTYEMHRKLVRDAEGRPTGMRMMCVDVTEAKKDLDEARGAHLVLESVFNSIGEAVIATDAVGFIRSVNPAAEKLLGFKAGALIGMSIEEGLPIVATLPAARSESIFTAWLERRMKGFATILDRERREIHVGISASPIQDKGNGSTVGVVILLREVEISG